MSAKSRQGVRKHRLKTLAAAAVTCLVVVTGCSPSGARAQALNELSSQVHYIRGAASVGDFETALEQLDVLRSRAWDMFRQDELPQADLENILAAAEAVENHLSLSPDPPPQPPAEAPPEPEQVDEEEEEARRQAEGEAKEQEEETRKQAEEEAKEQEEAHKQAEEAAKEKQKDQSKEQKQAEGGDEGEDGEDDEDDEDDDD